MKSGLSCAVYASHTPAKSLTYTSGAVKATEGAQACQTGINRATGQPHGQVPGRQGNFSSQALTNMGSAYSA